MDINTVGTISHYNGLLFNNITAFQADCEGALAVGGNAQFGSGTHGYDVGGAGVPGWESTIVGTLENPNQYPSLLLGGIVNTNSTTARIYTGKVVMKLSHQQHYEDNIFRFECSDGISFVQDEICEDFFTEAKEQVSYTSNVLTQGNLNTITLSDLQNLGNLELSDYENENIKTDANILCFNLDCNPGDSIKVSEIDLTDSILDYDAVIINIPAGKITFADGAMLYNGSPIPILPKIYPGNELVKDFASRLIFNFPNASEVSLLTYSVIGSIIAPNAIIDTVGGSINGMLIAESLFQDVGMQLHAFTIPLGEALWSLALEQLTGNVQVIVRDSSDNSVLPGALFSLYLYNEDTSLYDLVEADIATSSDGEIFFEDLILGSYKLVETTAPLGYALPETTEVLFEIELNDEGEVIQVNTIYVGNSKLRGNVKFSKIDSENHEIKLEGAIFSLFVYDDETDEYELVYSGLTTLENGFLEIENLLPGDYKLVETKAPEGYYLGTDTETLFTISIDQHGDIIVPGLIDITNIKLGCVQIVKTDSEDTQIRLPGALFTLKIFNTELDEYENIRTGLVTDENGILLIENLEPGDYKLVETKAPHGYKLPDNPETLFTVSL